MNVTLPWPPRCLHPNARPGAGWTDAEVETLRKMHGQRSLREIAVVLGRSAGSIRGQITRLGISKKESYPEALIAELKKAYSAAGVSGFLDLETLAEKWSKDAGNLSRKARELGLPTSLTRQKKVARNPPRSRKFESQAQRSAYQSQRMKALWRERPHPRGATGLKHTEEAKNVISRKSAATWASRTPEQRQEHRLKSERGRRLKGIKAPAVRRGKWYAGWREVGGQRVYFRSRWEANYARYLEWLKSIGQIAAWEHEAQTFWFEGVKRGCVSYLPDFKVTNPNGAHEWHEVKGWMDARSATAIKRMAKYHPAEKVIVIRDKQYREIRRKVAALIPGWEDEAKRKDWAGWQPEREPVKGGLVIVEVGDA